MVWADKYYVYIEEIGHVDKGEEAGHSAKGDIIAINPYTKQYKPTEAERSSYKIIVVDMTLSEKNELVKKEQKVHPLDPDEFVDVTFRKRKVDATFLSTLTQEQNVTKVQFLDKVIVKPTTVSRSP